MEVRKMNVRKSLMGLVALMIIGTQLFADSWGGYKGAKPAYVIDAEGIVHYSNDINRSKADVIKLANLGPVNPRRIVIKQMKNPCFFFDEKLWKFYNGKKIDEYTIQLSAFKGKGDHRMRPKTSIYPLFTYLDRPDLGNGIITSKDKILSAYGNSVLQILGESPECRHNLTEETWIVYEGWSEDVLKEKGRYKFNLK